MVSDRSRRATRAVDYTCKVGTDIVNDIYNDTSINNTTQPHNVQPNTSKHNKALHDISNTRSNTTSASTGSSKPVKSYSQALQSQQQKHNNIHETTHTNTNNKSVQDKKRRNIVLDDSDTEVDEANTYRAVQQHTSNQLIEHTSNRHTISNDRSNNNNRSNNYTASQQFNHTNSVSNSVPTSHSLSCRDIVSQLNHRDATAALIEQKDTAYNTLLDKYNRLKQQCVINNNDWLGEFDETSKQQINAAEKLAQHWKLQYQQLQVEYEKLQIIANEVQFQRDAANKYQNELTVTRNDMHVLNDRVKQLESESTQHQQHTQQLQQQHQTELQSIYTSKHQSDTILAAYRMLTSSRIDNTDTGVRCKMVNRQHKRVMEFDLNYSADNTECEYIPKKIQMNGVSYSDYLQDTITFQLEQAPLFTRNLLDTLFSSQEQQLIHSPHK